jgi:hypothetical protein
MMTRYCMTKAIFTRGWLLLSHIRLLTYLYVCTTSSYLSLSEITTTFNNDNRSEEMPGMKEINF